ncbi:GldG family protein [Cylindrospermum sp. FACHB-282]|uniref:GldG family protein n=1 Tax=Cylindrospermum sp. FACHB-282 TaxID=2692794 RepID=UPI0016832042|nr:Gldg family protein [Cylindrospermum sp. FACHB-282]MBD2387518.1 Gldg family protein [Cylindrospermum sp. FACHB-282]
MTNFAKKQLWKFLFWLGPFFVAVGLTSALISETWGRIPLAFLITGIVICGLWVIWQAQQSKWWGRRSTQASTNALIATFAVLVILGLINFLGIRYHLRTDLTETQLFTLAPQSRELVSTLPQSVKAWIFDVNQNPQDRELLENYQRQSSKFTFEYINPQAKPGLAEKFGVKEPGEVYLEYGDKRQLVDVVNDNVRLTEIRLTNRLQQIISSSTAKVYFLQGHGEHQLSAGKGAISQASQALADKNFTTSALNLADNAKIPEDATVLIVAGPKRSLFEGEVKALQDYLNRGGNLLLMIDPNTDPKIDSLLKEWGVILDNRLAVDISGESLGLGPAAPLVTEYGQHPITKDFGNGISFYPVARHLEITPVADVESTPLLRTKPYPNSWAESDQKSEKLEFNEGKDLKGPLTLGMAFKKKLIAKSSPTPTASPTRPSPTPTISPTAQSQASPTPTISPTPQSQASPTPTASPTAQTPASPTPTASPTAQTPASPTPTAQTPASPTPIASPTTQGETLPREGKSAPTPTESRLVVLGNSDFATDGLFQQQLNGDVFLNSVTWLSQQDQQPLSIRPKEPKNRRITLSINQGNFLILSSLLVLPLIGLVTAAIIWWRRR